MEKKLDYQHIEQVVKKRSIKNLIHFTPTINFMSMVEQQAILSRDHLEKLDIEQYDVLDYVQFTDSIRYDDKSYINLSITEPNRFLFRKFRERTKNDPSIEWCVLKLKTELLYWHDTLFSVTNAASYAAKREGINGTSHDFEKLFQSELLLKNRVCRFSGMANNLTTDNQAEVLVKNKIPFSYVEEVCFVDECSMASTLAALSFLEFDTSIFTIDKSLFI